MSSSTPTCVHGREGNREAEAFYKEYFDKGYRDPIGTGEVKKQVGVLWTSYGMKRYANISAGFRQPVRSTIWSGTR